MRWRLYVSCNSVDPAFIQRWHDVYLYKTRSVGELKARKWFMEFVPDECKAELMARIQQGNRK